MFRRFGSVAVLACLSLLTAGAVQARPLAAYPAAAPSGFFQQIWQWVTSVGSEVQSKEGAGMDPNGQKLHPPPARGTGAHQGPTAAKAG